MIVVALIAAYSLVFGILGYTAYVIMGPDKKVVDNDWKFN